MTYVPSLQFETTVDAGGQSGKENADCYGTGMKFAGTVTLGAREAGKILMTATDADGTIIKTANVTDEGLNRAFSKLAEAVVIAAQAKFLGLDPKQALKPSGFYSDDRGGPGGCAKHMHYDTGRSQLLMIDCADLLHSFPNAPLCEESSFSGPECETENKVRAALGAKPQAEARIAHKAEMDALREQHAAAR